MKDLNPKELEDRYKQNDILEQQYQGSYPPSCNSCPNNPNNYELDEKWIKENE